MQTIKKLAKELNLSYSATRRRIKALGEVMEKHTKRNNNSKITVDSEGTELIRRLEELRDQGLTIEDAANKIKNDLSGNSENGSDKKRQNSANPELVNELQDRVNELKQDKKELQQDKDKLRQQLEEKDRQIQQLLPASQEEKKPEASPWKLFKNWLFKPQ